MVKICQTQLLKLNVEIIPKKRIFRLLPKISAGHVWSWKIFFANFQILGLLGCQGWVVIPQNVKKSQNHCTLSRALMVRSVWRDSTRDSWWLRVPTAATSWATNPSAWTLRSGAIRMPACGSWPALSWTASGGRSAASRMRRSPLASAMRRAASVWPPRRPPPATRLHWPLVPGVRSSCGDSGRRSGGTECEYCGNTAVFIDGSVYVKGHLFIAEKDAVICNAIYF